MPISDTPTCPSRCQHETIEKAKAGELTLKRVASQVLGAVFRTQNRAAEANLRAFLRTATAELPRFAGAFSLVFGLRLGAIAQSFTSARLIALRLSYAVVDAALTGDKAEEAASAPWLRELVASQATLLEATIEDSPRSQAIARKAVVLLVRKHRETLLPLFHAVLVGADGAVPQDVPLHSQLWLALTQFEIDQAAKEKLWTLYMYWAFESKVRTAVVLETQDPRFKGLGASQFEAIVKPTMVKMLKKSPDSVLEPVAAFVRAATPLDFGVYLNEVFVSVFTAKLRSQKEDVRQLTIALAKALVATFQQAEHFEQLVTAISGLLDGKHGILAQFYMREAAFAVLCDAADAATSVLTGDDATRIAGNAIPALLKAASKEAHDQTRHLGLLALGKWAVISGGDLSADSIAAIKTGLKNKAELTVVGYLRALAVLVQSAKSPAVATVQVFTDEILAVFKDSSKKTNIARLDGLLAVGIAGALASANSSVDALVAKEGVADVLLSSSSFVDATTKALLSVPKASLAGEYETPEVTALALVPSAIAWVLSSKQADASAPYKLLVDLLCSSSLTVRCSAETTINAVYASSVDHVPGLVAAFQQKLTSLAAAQEVVINSRDEDAASVVPPGGVLRKALRTLVPGQVANSESVKESVFATVLLLAHHPFLVDGKKQPVFSREWESVQTRFLVASGVDKAAVKVDEEDEDEHVDTPADEIDHVIEDNEAIKSAIIRLLADDEQGLLYSSYEIERLAAQRVLATLLEFAGNGEGESIALHDTIEELLATRFEREGISALTETDENIFLTPFDELYVAKKKGDGEETTRTRGGGRRGNADEQWEQQLREELAQKKSKDAKETKKYSAQEKAQLAEQQALRTKLQGTFRAVSYVLEAFDMLATTKPDELHPTLPFLLKSVGVLFGCGLFSDHHAVEGLRSISKSITPAVLRADYQSIASSVRVCFELDQLRGDSRSSKIALVTEMKGLLSRTTAELMEYVFGFQFDSEADFDGDAPCNYIPPPTFHLVFPILRSVILLEPSLRHWALPLFAVHARMIPEEEEEEVGDVAAQRLLRKDMIELALHLLGEKATGGIAPITNPDLAPGKLLTKLCLGSPLSEAEWEPLLGDEGLLSEHAEVRADCLRALVAVAEDDELEFTGEQMSLLLTCRMFCARFDVAEENRAIAQNVWELTEAQIDQQFTDPLLTLLSHAHDNVRESASLAIADGLKQFPETVTPIINQLKAQFLKSVPPPVEHLDEFGNPMVRRPGQAEPEEDPVTVFPRNGVALCLEKASTAAEFTNVDVMEIMSFVMEHGWGDPNAQVRAHMRKTGIQVVTSLGGGSNTTPLLQLFERFLETKPSDSEREKLAIYDHQREGVVVCLGSLAKHMDKTDPKVSSIVDSLLEALSIPSESVQRSVATCLAPLIPTVKDRSTAILDDLLSRATTGETFGERIGAAYGVSAVVKGLGISALKQHDIIPRLEESMKTDGANARQGSMLVFECLSQRLGILFEPYIIVILPIMLRCAADSNPQVREAASQTAKGIMANLSAHGVKLVLPSLLRALEESAWRTKQSGIQILGSMAYCAPRQLGSCLPQVVPKLTLALTDSHPRVREAGKSALRDIGSVVRNPEIATISNALLNALEDPNKHTTAALLELQSTSFVHSIDAPSLALVMPIVARGLKDRAGDAKKTAALIVGSMCSMINDPKDLIPYIDMVLPSLKTQLMDPIPEVRAVAAKAMGKLVKGLGEKHFADILAWLLDAIKGETYGSVERSGAAQGLCEVVVALGKDRVEATMLDDIFPLARHPKYSVREGVLWIIAFLPPAFGKSFSMFLQDALPIVVSGLSDEAESVRDVAMHAGHVVVNAHALSHTKEILPSLEAGLFDDSWRIRQSSVALLGDLMYRISGTRAVGLSEVTSGEIDEDDDAAGSAAGDKAITKILGMERRNAILASLYMIRSDTSAVVRQSALQVWKSVVANTPKTLRQILETLMAAIVNALSGDNTEKQTMAGRTLGEIVRKLGEHVLPEVVPILRAGLSTKNSSGMRQGVCIGLAEVIDCCTKKQLEDFVDTLVDAVLDGLSDELPEVRNSAAQAFDALHRGIGYRAIDETVPSLLQRINNSANSAAQEHALLGLQEILRVKSREVLPYLIPRLLTTPLTKASVRAMSRVAQATGTVIHFQVERVFAVFISQYVELLETDPAFAEDIKASLRGFALSVEDVGVHWLAIELCKYCEHDGVQERTLALQLVGEFCANTRAQYNEQAALFLKQIVIHLNDSEASVVQAASDAFKGMNVTLRPEVMVNHLDFIRQSINSMVSDARHRKGGVGAEGEYLLQGLCIPKGLEPFLPSYQFALMNGSPELRQSAAAGLGELVQLSSAATLRPYLIKLTGPLIRIAGDRFPGHVKAAILETLEILLTKGGVALKPFLPQLQTTFVKALNDTAVDVRARGASALSRLVTLSPRVEPLVAELTERLRSTTGGIREANLEALTAIVEGVGSKLSSAAKDPLEQALAELLDAPEDAVRELASKCLAFSVATSEGAEARVVTYALADKSADELVSLSSARRQSAAAFITAVLAADSALVATVADPVGQLLSTLGQDDQIAVRNAALRAIAAFVKHDLGSTSSFLPLLTQGVEHPNKDVNRQALRILKRLAKRDPAATRAALLTLVPPTFQLIKSPNIAVKLSAERALLYLLEVHGRPETVTEYVASTDAVNGKIIAEYTRRVLAKLKTDSGDESD